METISARDDHFLNVALEPHRTPLALMLPEDLARELGAVVVNCETGKVRLALAAIPSETGRRRLERASGVPVDIVLWSRVEIESRLRELYGPAHEDLNAPLQASATAPAVRSLDELLTRGMRCRASDVHIELDAGGASVRMRIDGRLYAVGRFEESCASAIISRIKVLAGMDIAERRLPQDGRYTTQVQGRLLDVRASSMPASSGEKIVLRLIDRDAPLPGIEDLGMPFAVRSALVRATAGYNGFLAVCGPTGSGKTTTLYALLAALDRNSRNVTSVEDPIERKLLGITQVQVAHRAGLSFAAIVRALMRQDANVIMIGEMRDGETATAAAAAALSGQLVMTTLHAADAPRAIDRLTALGVSRPTLATTLSGVLSQRLVRRLCPLCREPYVLEDKAAAALGVDRGGRFFRSRGCRACDGTGFRGRIAAFEYLDLLVDDVADAVGSGATPREIGAIATAHGYRSLRADILDKCRCGIVDPHEALPIVVVGACA